MIGLTICRAVATLAIGAAAGIAPAGVAPVAAQAPQGQPQQLVYGIYDGTSTASRVFGTLTAPGQPGAGGAFAAIANEGKGTVDVQQQKSSGLAQTALLSGIIGLLGPQGAAQPGGTAAAGGTAVDSLRSSLVPGTSAVVAIVSEPAAPAVAAALQQGKPRRMMNARIATP
jgi:hypothetical protein